MTFIIRILLEQNRLKKKILCKDEGDREHVNNFL